MSDTTKNPSMKEIQEGGENLVQDAERCLANLREKAKSSIDESESKKIQAVITKVEQLKQWAAISTQHGLEQLRSGFTSDEKIVVASCDAKLGEKIGVQAKTVKEAASSALQSAEKKGETLMQEVQTQIQNGDVEKGINKVVSEYSSGSLMSAFKEAYDKADNPIAGAIAGVVALISALFSGIVGGFTDFFGFGKKKEKLEKEMKQEAEKTLDSMAPNVANVKETFSKYVTAVKTGDTKQAREAFASFKKAKEELHGKYSELEGSLPKESRKQIEEFLTAIDSGTASAESLLDQKEKLVQYISSLGITMDQAKLDKFNAAYKQYADDQISRLERIGTAINPNNPEANIRLMEEANGAVTNTGEFLWSLVGDVIPWGVVQAELVDAGGKMIRFGFSSAKDLITGEGGHAAEFMGYLTTEQIKKKGQPEIMAHILLHRMSWVGRLSGIVGWGISEAISVAGTWKERQWLHGIGAEMKYIFGKFDSVAADYEKAIGDLFPGGKIPAELAKDSPVAKLRNMMEEAITKHRVTQAYFDAGNDTAKFHKNLEVLKSEIPNMKSVGLTGETSAKIIEDAITETKWLQSLSGVWQNKIARVLNNRYFNVIDSKYTGGVQGWLQDLKNSWKGEYTDKEFAVAKHYRETIVPVNESLAISVERGEDYLQKTQRMLGIRKHFESFKSLQGTALRIQAWEMASIEKELAWLATLPPEFVRGFFNHLPIAIIGIGSFMQEGSENKKEALLHGMESLIPFVGAYTIINDGTTIGGGVLRHPASFAAGSAIMAMDGYEAIRIIRSNWGSTSKMSMELAKFAARPITMTYETVRGSVALANTLRVWSIHLARALRNPEWRELIMSFAKERGWKFGVSGVVIGWLAYALYRYMGEKGGEKTLSEINDAGIINENGGFNIENLKNKFPSLSKDAKKAVRDSLIQSGLAAKDENAEFTLPDSEADKVAGNITVRLTSNTPVGVGDTLKEALAIIGMKPKLEISKSSYAAMSEEAGKKINGLAMFSKESVNTIMKGRVNYLEEMNKGVN